MAEIRINATGGVKLYDADDSHYAQIVAGTITSNVDAITLGHDTVTIADNLSLGSDSAVLKFGADGDTTLTHTDGTGLTLNSTNKLCFNDASQFVQGSSNAVLSIGATDEIDLTATAIDINGTCDISGTFSLGGTNITTTAAEINLIDGGTSRGTTAVASGDGILINDGGTMRMTNVDTVSTYFASHSVGGSNIVTTGALDSGSITSGFGTIDTGSSTITTTGLITGGSLDIDNVLINGTTIGHTDDTDLITVADGLVTVAGTMSSDAIIAPGAVIQQVRAYLTTGSQITSSGALSELSTSLRCAITPKHADSYLILEASGWFCIPNSAHLQFADFYNVTASATPFMADASGSRKRIHWAMRTFYYDANDYNYLHMRALGAASDTNARTYTVRFGTEGVTAQFLESTLNTASGVVAPFVFTVTEVGA